jgi:hypothetical protein
MSHYTTVRTQLVSKPHLLAALKALGFLQVEVHASPQTLRGWESNRTAEIILRREHLSCSADVGFARNATGTYDLVVAENDTHQFGNPWLARLSQTYAYGVAKQMLKEQQFEVVEEKRLADQTIRISVRRMT